MDLEERTIEHLPDRCENCGAELTDVEKSAYLEANRTGPVLCTTCAAEVVPLDEADAPVSE